MTKQIYAINAQDTKKSERTGKQFAIRYFLFFVTSFIFTPLVIATQTKSIVKENTKQSINSKNKSPKKKRRKKTNQNKKNTYKNKRKNNPNLLKNVQKRSSISIGYAEIKTKRMLTKARVAKKDHASLSTSIMKQARTHMQKNRVDRNEFNDLVKQKIKAHKKSKKNPIL